MVFTFTPLHPGAPALHGAALAAPLDAQLASRARATLSHSQLCLAHATMSILEDALPSQRVYPGEPGYLKGRGHLKTTSVVCCCITNDTDGDDDMCCLAMSMCCWWAYFCGREDAVWIRYDSSEETAELQQVDLGASESLADD